MAAITEMDDAAALAGETAILNSGLELAMEWGKEWLRPIHERLAARYPGLSAAELEAYDRICRESMTHGNQLLYSMVKHGLEVDYPTWSAIFLLRYPWADEDNLSRLFNQSMYYAMK